ncbi:MULTISPECIES: hypothetical protein [Streptomyces]|uniref:hypothetical protein n=1 Tax=Streptomyces TaxID=1883 RepID=UPI001B37B4C0|nr:hypothetical protein [Streptomyces sp. C3-3]MBQ1117024.1 hypothetical protein [Streptomyces sp. C3-3]
MTAEAPGTGARTDRTRDGAQPSRLEWASLTVQTAGVVATIVVSLIGSPAAGATTVPEPTTVTVVCGAPSSSHEQAREES